LEKMPLKTNVEIIPTRDGSPTLRTASGITYHSTYGAVQEAQHVFLNAGFFPALEIFGKEQAPLRVFEMGFGTGLNAFLTALESERITQPVEYFTVEKHPLFPEIYHQLSYPQTPEEAALFRKLHEASWNVPVAISPYFQLQKIEGELESIILPSAIHLIYFDAFAPEDHPSAWTEAIFRKLYLALLPGGLLTTYCSKGVVRRALQSAGFLVEKLPGPPGKREMVRARRQ